MARSEGRLQFGMWRKGLEGYGPHAKLLYAVLLTETTVNHAGVGAWRPTKWAGEASLTVVEMEKALADLRAGDPREALVIVDDATEEILVRTLIRNDKVADQPYVLKAALKAAIAVQSPLLRWVLAQELRKLPPKKADVEKGDRKIVYPDPHACADELDPPGSKPPGDRRPTPSPEPSETLFDASPESLDREGFERVGGGGGGGGGGEGPVGTNSGSSKTPAPKRGARPTDDPAKKIAHEITKAYAERIGPMVNFPAVLGIVGKAVKGGHATDAISSALDRLNEAGRPVTTETLRIELGRRSHLKAVSGGYQPYRDPEDPSVYEQDFFPEDRR